MAGNSTFSTDNNIHERGIGKWAFVVYNPGHLVGPIDGYLAVGKDFHTVYLVDKDTAARVTIANIPSQNVAYVLNTRYATIPPSMRPAPTDASGLTPEAPPSASDQP
jgi:hypothetical protein